MTRKHQNPEVELEYLLTGEENKGTIMFVHGVGSNLKQFQAQHDYFSKNFKVLSVSLRGHGNSSPAPINTPEEYTLAKNSNDILLLLEYLKIDQVHFVGNSAGGLIGYKLFLLKPKLFASIVTFGTTAELKLPDFTVNILSSVDKLMLKYNPKGYAKFLGKHSSKYKHVQKELSHIFASMGKGILMRQNIGSYSYISILEKINVPYLLIQGEDDEDINENLETTIMAINHNKNAAVVMVENAGHFLNLEQPDVFNTVISDFINHFNNQ